MAHVDPLLWYFRPSGQTKYIPKNGETEMGVIVKRRPRCGARYLREWARNEQAKATHPATFDVEVGNFTPFQGFRLPGGGKVRLIKDELPKKKWVPPTFDKSPPVEPNYRPDIGSCAIL